MADLDPRAQMLAAAEIARQACLQKVEPVGFPGAIARRPRAKKLPAGQTALWDAAELAPPPSDGDVPKGPKLTLIQAAIRTPTRPCPEMPKPRRCELAVRDSILLDDDRMAIRTAVGDAQIYTALQRGEPEPPSCSPWRRVVEAEAAAAIIVGACPDARGGTALGGCIIVNPDGPRPSDRETIQGFLWREALRRKSLITQKRGRRG